MFEYLWHILAGKSSIVLRGNWKSEITVVVDVLKVYHGIKMVHSDTTNLPYINFDHRSSTFRICTVKTESKLHLEYVKGR